MIFKHRAKLTVFRFFQGEARKSRRGLTTMSLTDSNRSTAGNASAQASGGGGGQATTISQDGNSSGTNAHGGRKSNWEVIEHYRNSGEPASLMATTSHSGVGRIDSYRGESSFAQNSHTTGDGYDMDTHDTHSTSDESILKDHSDDWWNIFALCGRVFRYIGLDGV